VARKVLDRGADIRPCIEAPQPPIREGRTPGNGGGRGRPRVGRLRRGGDRGWRRAERRPGVLEVLLMDRETDRAKGDEEALLHLVGLGVESHDLKFQVLEDFEYVTPGSKGTQIPQFSCAPPTAFRSRF
jgi:hypothetical protein